MDKESLRSITAQINEGRRLIEEALASLESSQMGIADYTYKYNSLHILNEKAFLETFPTYVVKPRESQQYPTLLSITYQGIEFFALSQKPFPKNDGTTMICVSRPAQEAV